MRTTTGVARNRSKKRLFKRAKGYRGGRGNLTRTVKETLIDELDSLYASLTDGPEIQSSMFNGNNPDMVNDENKTSSQETQPLEDKKSRPSQECEEPPHPTLYTLG